MEKEPDLFVTTYGGNAMCVFCLLYEHQPPMGDWEPDTDVLASRYQALAMVEIGQRHGNSETVIQQPRFDVHSWNEGFDQCYEMGFQLGTIQRTLQRERKITLTWLLTAWLLSDLVTLTLNYYEGAS